MKKPSSDPFFDLPVFESEPTPPDKVAPLPYDKAMTFLEETIEAYKISKRPHERRPPIPERFEM